MFVSVAEHCPPGLDVDDQEKYRPSYRRPIDSDSLACVNYLTKALQQLGDAEAEDDGDYYGEISELVHGLSCSPRLATVELKKWFWAMIARPPFVRAMPIPDTTERVPPTRSQPDTAVATRPGFESELSVWQFFRDPR